MFEYRVVKKQNKSVFSKFKNQEIIHTKIVSNNINIFLLINFFIGTHDSSFLPVGLWAIYSVTLILVKPAILIL